MGGSSPKMHGKLGSRAAFALLASGLGAIACTVYDDSLLSSGDASTENAGQANGGSPPNGEVGGEGGLATSGGDAGNAGNDAQAGNTGNTGDAGHAAGGAGSVAGAANGGHPGSAGTAGALGTGGVAGALSNGGAAGKAGAPSGGAAGAPSGGAAGAPSGGASGAPSGGASGAPSGGASGSGGAVGTVLCSDHPLTAKTGWIPTASHQSTSPKNPPSFLVDNTASRWSTGKPQSGDEWLQINLGATVNIRSINLQQGADTNDYPRSYAVYISDTNNDITGTVRATGVGTPGVTTTIALPKIFSGRYLLIKQLGTSLSWWSVAEIEIACVDG